MWIRFNNNPVGRKVGDCSVRALSVALKTDWETAYSMIAAAGYNMGDMPSSDSVWGAVLRQDAVPATTDPTVTPAPVIEVQNANLTITRIA